MNSVHAHADPMLGQSIEGKAAWTRKTLSTSDYLMHLPRTCLAELDAVMKEIRANPLPAIVWTPDQFNLAACRKIMAQVKAVLDHGVRFALLDRLPVESMSKEEGKTLFWLLSSLIARPVAQKRYAYLPNGMIADVLDTGAKPTPGSGVRPDQTNVDLIYHNDNAYNRVMPKYIGLLCLQTAKSGGLSRVMSFYTVHNALLARFPEHLPRLYQPLVFDRQKEHFPDESPIFSAPVFEYDGQALRARLGLHQIRSGYAMIGEPIDVETQAAIQALDQVFADTSLSFDFMMERGQMQFANNRQIGHSRTQFEDHEAPEARRHMVRLWMRDEGHRGYGG